MSNVLITGANSGFGLLTTRKFAEAGHTVYAGYRSKDRAEELEALAAQMPTIRPVRLDVTDQGSIDGATAEARHPVRSMCWSTMPDTSWRDRSIPYLMTYCIASSTPTCSASSA